MTFLDVLHFGYLNFQWGDGNLSGSCLNLFQRLNKVLWVLEQHLIMSTFLFSVIDSHLLQIICFKIHHLPTSMPLKTFFHVMSYLAHTLLKKIAKLYL